MTMAAVLAEKIVSQLSISFPEAAILLYKNSQSQGSENEFLTNSL